MRLFPKLFKKQKAPEPIVLTEEELMEQKQQQTNQLIKDIAGLVWCYEEAKKVQRLFNSEVIDDEQNEEQQAALFRMADEMYNHPEILRKLVCEVAYHEPDYKAQLKSYQPTVKSTQ